MVNEHSADPATAQLYAPFGVVNDPAQFGLIRRHVKVSGRQVAIYRHPSASIKQPTLFLHGVHMSWSTWTPVLAAARKRAYSTDEWVFVDLPGFGESDPMKSADTMSFVGELIYGAFKTLTDVPPRIVGHSMGGFLALDMAARHPEFASEIVIFSGAYGTVVDIVNNPLSALYRHPAAAAIYVPQMLMARYGPDMLPAVHPKMHTALALSLSGVLHHPLAIQPSIYTALWDGYRGGSFNIAQQNAIAYDVDEVWQRICNPVTAIFGTHDRLVNSADARRFESDARKVKIIKFDQSSHFPHLEQPFEALECLTSACSV